VLPRALDGHAVPGEPLACVMNVWRRCAIAPGETVAIIGLGFLGALLAQLAARAGGRVIAVSQRAFSRDLAVQMGARNTIDLAESDDVIVKHVEVLTGGELCDCAIEVVGEQRPLDLAAKLCRVRGRIVIAGFHQDGTRHVDLFLWNCRGLDVINAHERDATAYVGGLKSAIAGLLEGKLDPRPLYTHRVPLERAGEAFEALRTRPDGFVKAVIEP
jgi:threonine dehydrogenase-like Zn-dependent dehydrogenase